MNRRMLSLSLAAAAALSMGTTPTLAAQPPIKVGIVFSYSGAGATAGPELDGAIAAWTKLHGDTIDGRKIEIVRRDDTGVAPDIAKRMAQELIVQDHVDLLAGLVFTPNTIAVEGISAQAHTPLLIVNSATSGILAQDPYAAASPRGWDGSPRGAMSFAR
jgi:branched-chain amino acid transport system substrate-binding protein